jgi:hypothetical protein
MIGLGAPPTLKELAEFSRRPEIINWSPAIPEHVRGAYARSVIALCVGFALPLIACVVFATVAHSSAEPSSASRLSKVLIHGEHFFVVVKEANLDDLSQIQAALARGAKVTLSAESAPAGAPHYAAPAGSISFEGVLVDGATWRPLNRPRIPGR